MKYFILQLVLLFASKIIDYLIDRTSLPNEEIEDVVLELRHKTKLGQSI